MRRSHPTLVACLGGVWAEMVMSGVLFVVAVVVVLFVVLVCLLLLLL